MSFDFSKIPKEIISLASEYWEISHAGVLCILIGFIKIAFFLATILTDLTLGTHNDLILTIIIISGLVFFSTGAMLIARKKGKTSGGERHQDDQKEKQPDDQETLVSSDRIIRIQVEDKNTVHIYLPLTGDTQGDGLYKSSGL